MKLASFTGEGLKQFFLPIFIPIGVTGNFLSFLVSLVSYYPSDYFLKLLFVDFVDLLKIFALVTM